MGHKNRTDIDKTIASTQKNANTRADILPLPKEHAALPKKDIHETDAEETAQAESAEQMLMLQQVNERLLVATIESQKLAEQLQITQDQMEIAKTAAEKANRAKSDFLSRMSHDLRTPLNAILGFAQLLDSGSPEPTPRQKTSIDQILHAGWYLLELINEILDLATVESGKISLSLEPMSLGEVLNDCQALIEPQVENSNIHMTFPQLNCHLLVKADRIRVKQVFLNLLSNAIKYNRVGGNIDVRCNIKKENRIRISVHDTGEGLSAEQVAQLFQPFNRLGQETSDVEGTGIGLVLSKRLVELMNGSIGVESTVGKGSEFWFELLLDVTPPFVVDDATFIEPTPKNQENAMPHTLLYVEDNATNLLLVEHVIADQSHIMSLQINRI